MLETKSFSVINRYLFTGLIIGLLGILYGPLLIHWYAGWLKVIKISLEHEYFSHGLIGLPFAGYISWLKRYRWEKLPNQNHPLGGIFLGLGSVLYLSNLPDLVNLSFPLILAGICLWLKGTPGLKLQAFPLLLALLATPNELPYLIAPYTLPLQAFIAGTAGFILTQLGIDVSVQQINLLVGGKIVEVAPHCAGLKMLFTSLYVSLILLYWTSNWKSRPMSLTFLFITVFVSVTANILRNTLLTLFYGTGNEAAFGWLHEGWGGDLYSAGMLATLIFSLRGLETLQEYLSFEPEIHELTDYNEVTSDEFQK